MTKAAARLIAFGAVVGATLRWALFTTMPVTTFPWATLTVNLVGCLVLGRLTVAPLPDGDHQRAATVGLCGGLTTFSTFAVELAELRPEHQGIMWLYLTASLVGGVAAFGLGRAAPSDHR